MTIRTLLAATVLSVAAAAPAMAQAPTVTIDTGSLSGAAEHGTLVYRGIPYAAPPIGPLRWKAPQPAAHWRGVRDGSKFGFACPQPVRTEPWAQVGAQSENCLFLNVWRPRRAGTYPVMVFLHGGSFTFGAAGVPLYDGAALAARGVVLVTVNYRLGRLGFFAHPALTREDPNGELGNYGIMDQVSALKWVRRNIAKFGGNPGNVTIFGESAGAGAVQLLVGTPGANRLFQKAISESGAGNSALFPIRGGALNAEAIGRSWADGIGLKNATPEQLRAVPVEEVTRNGRSYPFIDGKVVLSSPGDAFYRKTAARIPMIIGANTNEASLGFTEAQAKALLGDAFPELLAGYAALGGKTPAGVLLAAEAGFALPSFAIADYHATAGNRIWAYRFDQVPVGQRAMAPGTDHGGELEYVFGTKPVEHAWDARDAAVSKLMGDYWVRFARTGNPNGGGAPKWPQVTSGPTTYLYVGPDVHVATLTPLQERAKAVSMADSIKKWAASRPQ